MKIIIDEKTFSFDNPKDKRFLRQFLASQDVFTCTRCDKYEHFEELLTDKSDFLICKLCMEKSNELRS